MSLSSYELESDRRSEFFDMETAIAREEKQVDDYRQYGIWFDAESEASIYAAEVESETDGMLPF